MNYFQDMLNVNSEAFKKTMKQIVFVPILAIILIFMEITQGYVLNLLAFRSTSINFMLGFVRFIVSAVFMSAIISILSDIIIYNRFSFKSILTGYKNYLPQVSNTLFYLIIIEWVYDLLISKLSIPYINSIYNIFIFVIISNLYEQIYLSNNSGGEALVSSIEFVKQNIIQWIPTLIVFVITSMFFNITSIIYYFDFKILIGGTILSLILAFVTIYKANLFNILNGSSMRKRMFQRRF